MSKTQWTKGPWTPDTNVLLRGNHGAQFGFLNCEPGSASDIEARANMSLVTAAPEMAEALQGMLDCFGYVAGDCTDPEQAQTERAAVDAAVSALAKARGEQ